MEPHHVHGGILWDGWVLMLPGVFVAAVLATALVGMGISSLSMALAAVRPVGAQLAAVSMDVCEQAAEVALAAVDPMAARDAVRAVLSGEVSRPA